MGRNLTANSPRSEGASSVSYSAGGVMAPGGAPTSQRTARPLGDSLRGVVGIWWDRRMQCLIPLIMYSGLEMGFIWGDFTSNWVKPSVGTSYIGYVMAAF